MKIKSGLITEASGSLGGMTASHNRGGLYLRARTIPVNPNTPQQQAVRTHVSNLSSLWLSVLTPAQRASWDLYALNVPLPDRLGEPRNVGGLQMYIRSNVPRLQTTLPRVDTAPVIFNLGAWSLPIVSNATAAAQTIDVAYAQIDTWVSEDDAGMLVYASRAANLSINYFKGPYRFAAVELGDLALPPTPPLVVPAPFAFALGQRLFLRINVSRADGRLGAEAFFQVDTVA
jgi:hypothetical protein